VGWQVHAVVQHPADFCRSIRPNSIEQEAAGTFHTADVGGHPIATVKLTLRVAIERSFAKNLSSKQSQQV
jgi:hypothetical protein